MKIPKLPKVNVNFKKPKMPNVGLQSVILKKYTNIIPLIGVSTLLCGIIFVAVWQNYRQGANDPQIQNVNAIADALKENKDNPPESPTERIDLSSNPSEFTIVYDSNKKMIYSNAALDGKDPVIPEGFLDTAKKKGENRVTWQPKKGVRLATVVKYYNGSASGYVIAGKSLKETENRIKSLALIIGAGWLATIAFIILSSANPNDTKSTTRPRKSVTIKKEIK
ncbi:MAG: hypothetical protein UT66_C0018G0027 [candidate division CPR2 bacterium GW2011_GWC1_39_9]|uniref:Uncharacterized protein n=1 Tax=candidate division CPR2 bacterium GW2011_GWC2_39_10 TaxID=1618345 RepID=A0A0G0M0X1_UNCC2|nr:MAG: hypothetical protein UT18_C0013G0007 [candidate division CPR2 bacterium GW2011_GWC2_39_10]KKR34688.1 MAG: hypothetical protein UT66_C0018G0027 [candidate division CPR2 bacterium GW2011_GWC1_39_9]